MDPAEVDTYVRAAARLAGLDIEDAWWSSVTRQLAVLLEHAAAVEAAGQPSPEDQGPTFRP